MSRGPGRIQRTILEHLASSNQQTTFETLRWELKEALGTSLASQDLPNKWNTSVKRALDGLEAEKRIAVEERRLRTLEECVAHFPGKTLLGAARRLRLQLLPALLRGVQRGELFAHYNTAENESFYLKSLPKETRRHFREQWLHLEPRLIGVLTICPLKHRNAVFSLITKGKATFEEANLDCRGAFAQHVQACIRGGIIGQPLSKELEAFSHRILPPADAKHLQLRSYVHEFAHIPQHRGCTLRKETVEFLYRECPEVIECLPGFVAPKQPSRPGMGFWNRDVKHSPRLYALFDQSVFQNFRFLSLA